MINFVSVTPALVVNVLFNDGDHILVLFLLPLINNSMFSYLWTILGSCCPKWHTSVLCF